MATKEFAPSSASQWLDASAALSLTAGTFLVSVAGSWGYEIEVPARFAIGAATPTVDGHPVPTLPLEIQIPAGEKLWLNAATTGARIQVSQQ